MDITQVVDFIMTCDPEELSTINDAFSDRLDQLFAEPQDEVAPEEIEEGEEETPEEWGEEMAPADMLAAAPMSF